MIGRIRKTNIFDIDYISRHARDADKREAFLLGGVPLGESLDATPNLFETSYVWDIRGEMACMYGITPWEKDVEVIWFLATDLFDKHKSFVAPRCRKVFKELTKGHKYLFNYVHFEHKKALRWVEWLGFDIYSPEPVGVNGEYFCKIEVRNV